MPRHYFFLADPHAHVLAEQAADEPAAAKVPEWVNILPEPDADGLIKSRDNRVLHIDSLDKLAKRSNAALKKQGGGGPVDADHKLYGGWFTTGGGPALGWAEEFEHRPGKGLWSRTMWLPEGEQLISAKKYRYTSSVVSGETEAEITDDGWSVTWHIYPEIVEGFGITNIPALTTKSMFAERRRDERERDDLLAVMLAKFGLRHDAELPEVREAFKMHRFTGAARSAVEKLGTVVPLAAGAPDASDNPPHNLEKPTHPIDGNTPPLKKDAADEGAPDGGSATNEELAQADAAPELPVEPLPPAPAAADDGPAQLTAARKRIAELEFEAGANFVASLVHSGRLAPAQRAAALAQAQTPAGLEHLKALYANAPRILPGATAPPVPALTHRKDSPAVELARQGLSTHEITLRLKQRAQETNR